MAPPLSPLPDDLGPVFTVAEALEAGVPRWRLYADDIDTPFWGVRAREPASEKSASPAQRLIAQMKNLAPALPADAFFSIAAAAALWRIPMPLSEYDSLDVSICDPARALQRRGVRAHRVKPNLVRVVKHKGLRVTDPASTWAQLASRLSFRDLVAAGDAVVLAKKHAGPYDRSPKPPPLATLDDLADAAARQHPNVRTLRTALPLVRTNAWSRPESHARLLLLDAGLPEPELNYNVFDEIGHWVKCLDLAYPQWRVAIEYQSAYHREAVQYSRDVQALAELTRLGWYTVQLTSSHVFNRPQSTGIVVGDAITAQTRRPLYAPTHPELPT